MKAVARAQLKHLRMSPQKTRLIVNLIRGMKVGDALVQLQFLHKQAARPVKKLLESAVANAKNNHSLKEETLVIKTAFADAGAVLHRWMPRAMGRATPLHKRSSHITIVLEGEVDESKAKKIKVKTETKIAEDKKDEKSGDNVEEQGTNKKTIKKDNKKDNKEDKKIGSSATNKNKKVSKK